MWVFSLFLLVALSPLSHVSNLPATNCLLKVYSTSNTLERKLECQNFWTKTQYQRRIKREKLNKLAKNEIRRLEEREYTGIFTRKIQEFPGKCTSNIQKQTFFLLWSSSTRENIMDRGITTGCYGTRCPFSLGGMDMFWRVLKIFTYLTH